MIRLLESLNLSEGIKKDYLEFAEGEEDLIDYLEEENASYHVEKLNDNKFYIVNDKFVVQLPPNSEFQDAYTVNEFLYEIAFRNQFFYELTGIDYSEYFNENFWNQVGGPSKYNTLFHATEEENVESILETGLHTERESFSIGNRHIRGVVFAVTNPDLLLMGQYGDAIIRIQVDQMKKDGFTPKVTREPEFEEYFKKRIIGERLGIKVTIQHRPSSSGGVWEETVMIHSDIPPKYLNHEE